MMGKFLKLKNLPLILYVVSCISISYSAGDNKIFGFNCLTFGALSVIMLPKLVFAFTAWSANIFLLIAALIGSGKLKLKIGLGILSLILSLFALGVDELPLHEGSTTTPVDISFGTYLWILSFILFNFINLKKLITQTIPKTL